MATSKNAVEIDVEFKINRALRQIKRLSDNVHKSVEQSNKLNTSAKKVSENFNKSAKSTDKVKNDLKNADVHAKSMAESATLFSKALVSVAMGTQFIQAADTLGSAMNKLNYINAQSMGEGAYNYDKDGNKIGYSNRVTYTTGADMDKMFNSAQASRSDYGQFVNNVGKQAILAGDAFNHNMDAVIKFNELMGKAYAISGASSEETLSSMMQLTQALGAGVMQGDELKSVREGATLAYQMIEKYAQELYDTDESLKDLGSQGKITSDIVVAGILENAQVLDEAMRMASLTVGQFWTLFKNDAMKAFEPAVREFNKFLNVLYQSSVYEAVINLLKGIGGALAFIFKIARGLLIIVEEHKAFLMPFLTVLGAILTTSIVTALIKIQIETIAAIGRLLHLQNILKYLPKQFILIGIAAAVLFGLFYSELSKTYEGVKKQSTIVATSVLFLMSVIAAFGAVVAFSTGHAFLGILSIALMVLSLVLAYSILTKDDILRGIATVVGTVAQAGETVVAFSNWVWEECGRHLGAFKEACVTAWENVQTVFKNFCDNIVSYWDSMIGKLANTKLGQALGLEAIHRHAVVDLRAGTESVTGAYNNYLASHPNSVNVDERGQAAYQKWYSKTLTLGHKFQSSMSEFISNATGGNLDYGLPGVNPGVNDALGDIGKTADNTDKISDNMHLVTDDLKYLRDLAELEWKKEFTTANINVSMTNNNKIDNKNDIGDIAVALRDEIITNMKTAAAGSYS